MAIVDPHKVFENGENVDISKLNFYVELKVYKRNRLSSTNNSDDTVVVNMIGGSTGNTFTTDWTENKENFGITSIDYRINTSYVPQVDITFEDVRGQSFFNDFFNSKYNVLFDMPPPIFELTVKGYYGQAVSYRLHLIRVNSNFKSNGIFEIKASFVGMTFAPLADLLFDYLQVAPYLTNEKLLTGDVDTTLELKTSAKQLVSIVKSATDADRKFINDKSELKRRLDDQINSGNFITAFVNDINSVDNTNTGQNKGIKAEVSGNIVTIKLRYYYITNAFINRGNNDDDKRTAENLYTDLKTHVDNYKDLYFTQTGIPLPATWPVLPPFNDLGTNKFNVDTDVTKATIDFGNINQQIIDKTRDLADDIKDKSNITSAKVESIVFDKIKGGPTLRNVLTILMADAKRFYTSLASVVKDAQNNRKGNTDTSTGDAPQYAFPQYFSINENNQKVKTIPKDETWDEVKFVNKYINAKLKATTYEDNAVSFQKDSDGNFKYVPISPFDSPIFSDNIYRTVNKDNIFDVVLSRGNVFLKESFANQAPNTTTKNISISYAKNEAYNILETLKNTDLLKWFILELKNNKIQTYPTTFNTQLQNSFYEITEASTSVSRFNFNGIYTGGRNFDLLSIGDFNNVSGGVPILKQAELGSNNDLIKKTQTEITNINGYFGSEFSFGNNQAFCQYNVPFYVDNGAKKNPGNKNYTTDFVNGKVFTDNRTVLLSSDEFYNFSGHTGSPDDFLRFISGAYINVSFIKNPFEIDTFKKIAAIHEIPMFVVAFWGYISKNYLTNPTLVKDIKSTDTGNLYIQYWNQIPNDLQNKFIAVYNEYVNMFNAHTADMTLLLNQDINFFEVKDGFFTSFIESKYLVLGDTILFNSNETSKVIDFHELTEFYDNYFNSLSREILNNEQVIIKNEKDTKQTINVALNDGDVRSELYYSFKSFVDRWMLGGSSFNYEELFDVDSTFLMVDRAFNSIGDKVILDLTPLWDSNTSSDTSLYTLLLNILTKNNFEFFALPTFIDFKDGQGGGPLWSDGNIEKIFGTFPNIPVAANPKFICMYVGGTSAQLDIGVINPDSMSHPDDSGSISSGTPGTDIEDISNSAAVTAFKVDYGTINQSFFKDIQLDQLEFKETNESIILLDKIAKNQGKDVTETKSNSLFNVYQQRSYTCTLETMGNVMIQPTMYFDLTNIALFKGAYLILEVNHNITANHIKTKFKGVRVPKYMKPYVTKYSMIVNLDIGYGSDINQVNTTLGVNTGGLSKGDVRDIKSSVSKLGTVVNPSLPSSPSNNIKKALLDVISYAESTMGVGSNGGYDVLVGFGSIPAYSLNYNLPHNGNPDMADLKGSWFNRSQNSGAAGRYQINFGTWLNGNINAPFNSVNQDNRALSYILAQFNKYGLDYTKIDQTNFIKYIDTIASVWASLPYNNTINVPPKNKNWSLGSGFYPGQGGQHTVDELWVIFDLALKKYNGSYKDSDLITDISSVLSPDQQVKINSLHPAYQDKFKNLIIQIQQQTGYQVLISSAYRSLENQAKQANADSRNAPVGQSLHNYGLALDLNLVKNGISILKGDSTQTWLNTGTITIAKSLGFAWGGDFKGYEDNVHFEVLQISGQRFSGATLLSKAQQLFGINLTNFDGTKVNV